MSSRPLPDTELAEPFRAPPIDAESMQAEELVRWAAEEHGDRRQHAFLVEAVAVAFGKRGHRFSGGDRHGHTGDAGDTGCAIDAGDGAQPARVWDGQHEHAAGAVDVGEEGGERARSLRIQDAQVARI